MLSIVYRQFSRFLHAKLIFNTRHYKSIKEEDNICKKKKIYFVLRYSTDNNITILFAVRFAFSLYTKLLREFL